VSRAAERESAKETERERHAYIMQLVAPARFLDGVVFSVFLLFVSGFGLFLFGEFHRMCVVTEAKKLGYFSVVMDKIFPFPKKQFVFNLTHILLFAILISLLSMMHHPAQDIIQTEAEKDAKRKKKTTKRKFRDPPAASDRTSAQSPAELDPLLPTDPPTAGTVGSVVKGGAVVAPVGSKKPAKASTRDATSQSSTTAKDTASQSKSNSKALKRDAAAKANCIAEATAQVAAGDAPPSSSSTKAAPPTAGQSTAQAAPAKRRPSLTALGIGPHCWSL